MHRQIAHFYRETDESIQMGSGFAGTTKGTDPVYDIMRDTDIKEEPHAPTKDYHADADDAGLTRQPMLTRVPQIYREGKRGSVEFYALDAKDHLHLG